LQVEWVKFRKGSAPLHALCATPAVNRASYVLELDFTEFA
jgi:hypothetical protein